MDAIKPSLLGGLFVAVPDLRLLIKDGSGVAGSGGGQSHENIPINSAEFQNGLLPGGEVLHPGLIVNQPASLRPVKEFQSLLIPFQILCGWLRDERPSHAREGLGEVARKADVTNKPTGLACNLCADVWGEVGFAV